MGKIMLILLYVGIVIFAAEVIYILKHQATRLQSIAKDYAIENQTDGLVVFNRTNKLIYCNAPAKKIYPELEFGTYGHIVKDMDLKSELGVNIERENRIYEVFSKPLVRNRRIYGKMYVLNDVTYSYNYTQRLEDEVSKKTKEIARIERSVIASFANMVEARDGVTGLHIKRTSAYVEILAKALQKLPQYKEGLNNQYMETIIEAAPLHDIGKISIPDAILTKPARLTDEEFAVIKTHTTKGAEIIDDMLEQVGENQYLSVARDMAFYHHEKWDGSGYPCGLKEEDIPLSARIMAIADVYDALCSKRSYKEGFSKEKALQIIKEGKGFHFDPVLVDVFVSNIEQIEQI